MTKAPVGFRAQRLLEVVKLLPGIHLRDAQRRTGARVRRYGISASEIRIPRPDRLGEAWEISSVLSC